MPNIIKNTRRIYSSGGQFDPTTINSRITNLENNVYKITYYEIISGASGSITIPTGATINAGEFGPSGNCVLSEINGSNKPTYTSPTTSGGVVVTSSLNTSTGAWVKSGTTTSTNVALIYSINISALNYANLNNFYIIEETKDIELTPSSITTLTNKRITPRVLSITSSATPTINTNNYDTVDITALAAVITSMTTNLTGTPNNFDKLIIRIKDNGTARAITWGASFVNKGDTLPTTTVLSKLTTVGLIYNTTSLVWECVAVAQEA